MMSEFHKFLMHARIEQDESRYDIFVKSMSVKLQREQSHLAQTQRMALIGKIWSVICHHVS